MPIAEHLGFYRAGIDRVLGLSPYAGLLTVMHLAGLYQMRFGTDRQMPARTLSSDEERVQRQMLGELQNQKESLCRQLPGQGVPAAWLEDRRLWCNYKLLQVFDRLSLYFCMAPPRPAMLGPAPLDAEDGEVELTLRPVEPQRVAITPYPFDRDPLPLAVTAHVAPDRDYDGDENFRVAFAAAPRTELRFEVCGG
jgi:hypothetical protein